MNKRLYIHIGRPKSGSTAIQHFLYSNRDALERHGCLYPRTGTLFQASHNLSLIFLPGLEDAQTIQNETPKTLYTQLVKEVNASNVDRAIVSSENFFLIEPKKLPKILQQELDVKIVCYVRRQDEVLISSYLQEVRDNWISGNVSFEEYLSNPDRQRLLDYFSVIKCWAKVFGTDNVIVRVYEDGQMQGGDIYNDILDVIGLPYVDDYARPETRLNPTPARDVLEFICILNQCSNSEGTRKKLMSAFLNASEMMGAKGGFNSKKLFSAEQRSHVLRLFEDSNRKLAEQFLGREDGKLFYENSIKDDSSDDCYSGLEINRFAQMMASVFVSQQEDIFQLQNQFDRQAGQLRLMENALDDMRTGNVSTLQDTKDSNPGLLGRIIRKLKLNGTRAV